LTERGSISVGLFPLARPNLGTHPRPTSSGILHVTQIVPDVLKGCDAFVFKVKQSKIIILGLFDYPNIVNHLHIDTVLYPKRPEAYTALL